MIRLIQKIAAGLAFVFCAVWYCKTYFYRDPGSAFFDAKYAYEERYSQHRKGEIRQFIESAKGAKNDTRPNNGANATLCVALSSVKRPHTQYLETAIGSLIYGLDPRERADLYLNVLIAHADPTQHPTWHEQWAHAATDNMSTYNVNDKERAQIQDMENSSNYVRKGVYDYVHAMRRCYETEAPYIGMFEDDVMLADGWLVRTLLGLRRVHELDEGKDSWLFMRLFNEDRSIGWASHKIGGNHELWIIAAIALGVTLPTLLARRKWRPAATYLDLEAIGVFVLLVNPALVILFFQAGKASLLPPRPGVYNEPFGCCSQTLIFPRAHIPAVMQFLDGRKGQVDLLLEDIAKAKGLSRYALYPVQAQHIGLDSARMTKSTETQAIWSIAFEDLSPAVLAQQHSSMVSDYYGLEPS